MKRRTLAALIVVGLIFTATTACDQHAPWQVGGVGAVHR